MSTESNKKFMKDLIEGRASETVRGNGDIRDAFSPDFVFHTPIMSTDGDHSDNIHATAEIWGRAMPNFRFKVDWMVAEGDWVTVHMTMGGDHQGPFEHPDGLVEPSGQTLEAGGLGAFRLRDGQITDYWLYTNMHEVVRAGAGTAGS